MTAFAVSVGVACNRRGSAGWPGRRRTTTGRWRDKKARGAPDSGCGFSRSYAPSARCARFWRTSRFSGFRRLFHDLPRCAGLM
ncbi:hypothetical protein Agau_L300025 [Agrobacterium tumefaciens F2]|nr:hypothetical protein Agau_L300025 [Agrobacterium tumefaciens F2]